MTKSLENRKLCDLVRALKKLLEHEFSTPLQKDDQDIILDIVHCSQDKEIIKNVKRVASNVLFFRGGARYIKRENMLMRENGYTIVCLEEEGGEWSSLGIKTPIGIIRYEQ